MTCASRCRRLPWCRDCWRRPSMGKRPRTLWHRLDETLGAMSGMLNTLLDINQIEAGTVHAEVVEFPINDLLERLRDEFAYHAQAKRLVLRVVPCSLVIRSDPRLLEQMVRNLLSNAMKYTRRGKVLLGCRRREGGLSIGDRQRCGRADGSLPEAELGARTARSPMSAVPVPAPGPACRCSSAPTRHDSADPCGRISEDHSSTRIRRALPGSLYRARSRQEIRRRSIIEASPTSTKPAV